jgi:hypothetical protein
VTHLLDGKRHILTELRQYSFIALLIFVSVYLFWQWVSPTVVVRYRLTVSVALGDEILSGSSIFELKVSNNWIFPIGGEWSGYAKGEAVAVDLGPRGVLVATMVEDKTRKPSLSFEGLENLAAGPLPDGGFVSDWIWQIKLPKAPIQLKLDQLPMLVWFRSPSDPNSLKRITQVKLNQTFAPGMHISGAMIEYVPQGFWPFNCLGALRPNWLFGVPLLKGIERLLPWLQLWKGGNFLLNPSKGADSFGLPPEFSLDKTAFVRK